MLLLPMMQLLRRTMVLDRAMSRMFKLILIVILLSTIVSSKSVTGHLRVKKHAADQRVFELQALLALAKNLPDVHEIYGHGQVNPFAAGRRRRSVVSLIAPDSQTPEVQTFVNDLIHQNVSSSAAGVVDDDRPLLRALMKNLRHRRSVTDKRR